MNQFCCQSIASYIISPNRRKRLELTISNVVMNQGDSHFGGVTGDLDGNGGWSSSSWTHKVYSSHKKNKRKRFCRWCIPLSKLDIESRQVHVFQVVVMDPVDDQTARRILDGPIIMVPIISKHIDCSDWKFSRYRLESVQNHHYQKHLKCESADIFRFLSFYHRSSFCYDFYYHI